MPTSDHVVIHADGCECHSCRQDRAGQRAAAAAQESAAKPEWPPRYAEVATVVETGGGTEGQWATIRWLSGAMQTQSVLYQQLPGEKPAPFQVEQNQHTRFIFGMPDYFVVEVASILRGEGMDLPAEVNLARVPIIVWYLNLYFVHGPDYLQVAKDALASMALAQKIRQGAH
jgi:hypothetical protein